MKNDDKPATEGDFWSPVIKNLYLVAAAKDMLAALELIVNDCEPGEDATLSVAGYNAACAAIAKAKTGRSL